MEREVRVHLDRDGTPVPVGRLWARVRGARESASFEYDASWLARRDAMALDPELPLGRGPFHTERPLFNVFSDASPDRWGQMLLRRIELARARKEGRSPRTLLAVDFLTQVADETRLGAVRLRGATGDAFLTTSGRRVPPLLELPKLLSATERVLEDRETEDDLALVLAPGTSLGGARPKASVRDRDGHLIVAKFPCKDDEWPITRWEAVALTLARLAGVEVPGFRLETVLKRPVLMSRRFDREAGRRVPFMSGVTALGAAADDTRSYVELAELLRSEGSVVKRDLRQLWRRVVFNVLVSNTDDHLRNHGFLHDGRGWRLAPAFDLNPVPLDVRPRVHALAIDEVDPAAPLERVLAIAPAFGLAAAEPRKIVAEVVAGVSRWHRVGAGLGLGRGELDRMATAFEHDDLVEARRLAR